jgi:hypothetical protein
MSSFRAEIMRVYDAWQHPIHPFIGHAFDAPDSNSLRVMTIGINAYLSPPDWAVQKPTWFSSWFNEETNPFDRGVARDAETIANALAEHSSLFAGLAVRGKEGIFHTNAIKTFLPKSIGRWADQISAHDYERQATTWHAELDIMAKHGALPHVVIVFGRPFWPWAWQAFHPSYRPIFSYLKVRGFQPASGKGLHYANLIEVEGVGGRQSLALLRVRHPASWKSSKATPEWVLSIQDVRELLRFR